MVRSQYIDATRRYDYVDTPAENLVLSSGPGVLRDAERGEQLPAAPDAGLPEYRLQVILNSVTRDEKALGDRTRVQAGQYGTGDLALASGEPVSAAKEVECLSRSPRFAA